jgi:hypothetical protein
MLVMLTTQRMFGLPLASECSFVLASAATACPMALTLVDPTASVE